MRSGLSQPFGVALDSASNVYIADTGHSAIKEWAAANSNVTTLVSSGLSYPEGLAVDSFGNIYIADTGNNAIKEWVAASSNVITLASSGLHAPYGVAVDGTGSVYIADTENNAIKKWTAANNTVTTLVSSGLSDPLGVALDSADNVYVADTGNSAIKELPYAFVDPTAKLESASPGNDVLPVVLPANENLLTPFAPTSDQSWLTISGVTNGVVSFSFTTNTGISRTAQITLLGQDISVLQAAAGAEVGPPVFSPPSGTYLSNGSFIAISCATPGAVIYFTTNGSPVNTNSAVYAAPIVFTGPGPFTVQALTVANGYAGPNSATATYSFPQAAAPVFTPPSGTYTNGTTILLSCTTPGAIIYYTLDGSIPSTNSTPYLGPLALDGGVTANAFAVAGGYINSAVTSVTYVQAQMGVPQFAPDPGLLTNGTLISITSTNGTATIYYTVDGSTPTTNSPIYTRPILFTNQITLQAQAYVSGFEPSGITSAFYGLLDMITNVAVTTFAGSQTAGFLDGMGVAAKFSLPQGICMDSSGNLFVSDSGNNCIRKILPSGQVITYAGNGTVLNSRSPSAANAFFNEPVGVCVDPTGNVYVGDSGDCNRICKIGADGTFAVYANITQCGPGIGNFAAGIGQLIAGPAGNLYVGHWAEAYKILTNGSVQGLAGTACACPGGWAVSVGLGLDSATNLYAATGNVVWLIAPDGAVNEIAGGSGLISDGFASQAGFTDLTGAAVDASGNIYLSDTVRIRKLSPSGWVSTVAGTGVAGYTDGPGFAAQFNGNYPWYLSSVQHMGLCLDAIGNLYVSDIANNCIRKVSFDTVVLPALQISCSTNLLTVTWPGWANDFVLESSGTLSAGGSWLPVTNAAEVLQGGTNIVWTNQTGNGASFYRLHKQ
ncbi:MAG: chitobiase/beta-hexosaminidase C-terminal domain-containing protein [Limisphaerales bacterium]